MIVVEMFNKHRMVLPTVRRLGCWAVEGWCSERQLRFLSFCHSIPLKVYEIKYDRREVLLRLGIPFPLRFPPLVLSRFHLALVMSLFTFKLNRIAFDARLIWLQACLDGAASSWWCFVMKMKEMFNKPAKAWLWVVETTQRSQIGCEKLSAPKL